jgi:hypothetical protein
VDARFNGMKLGAAPLWDAIERAARSEVTVYAVAGDAVVVDAEDEMAADTRRSNKYSCLGTIFRIYGCSLVLYMFC